tara:strand:- start:876 stop:1847 length:972 start_codon:yes stop_codon:yes gene_type:complete
MDKIWLEDYGFWIDERKYKYFVDKYEISDIINLNLTVGGTNMSNELQAFEALSKEEIMKMTGQDDGSQISSGSLPRLTINRTSEDDDGNALRTGVYTIYDSESEAKVYSLKDKAVHFRPFINAYQYMEYDAENNNYPCSSVVFKSWKDEPIDSNGGVRCGKVIGKDKQQLTQAEIDSQRNIKCYRLVYGLLSMEATTATGEATAIAEMPVLWRVTGMNFKPIGETLKSLKGRNSLMFNHVLNLTTKRKKSGSNVFYVASIRVDDKEIQFSKKDLEHMDMFNDIVNEENTRVSEKWKDANSNKKKDKAAIKVVEAIDPETILST